MKTVAKSIFMILLMASCVHAQETSWKQLNSRVITLYQQGRYAEAIEVAEEALKVARESFGPDHPDVATTLNNLAMLYYAQGRYAEAEPLSQRALAIREKALGPGHPDVAQSLNNLAVMYYEQGKYADAEPLQKRALAIREKALGPDHPDVAQSLNNLAALYKEMDKEDEAELLESRARKIQPKPMRISFEMKGISSPMRISFEIGGRSFRIEGSPVFFFILLSPILALPGIWKTYVKAGRPGWVCLIPIYNVCIFFRISGKPGWWAFLIIIPFANLFVLIAASVEFADRFGQSALFGIGLFVLPFITFYYLGFSNAQYYDS